MDWVAPAIHRPPLRLPASGASALGRQIETGLSILRHKGVEINQLLDPAAHAVSHCGGYHTAIAMTDQHNFPQIIILNDVQ